MSVHRSALLISLITLSACKGSGQNSSSSCAQGPWSDMDGDHHLPEGSFDNCEEIPEELARFADDCDDDNPARYGTAIEICDGVDNDCDDVTDEDAIDASTWYADTDGDGYGNSAVSAVRCDQPDGYVADNSDPDDSSASIHPEGSPTDSDRDGYPDDEDCYPYDDDAFPDAVESCDDTDNDCDGETDEDDAIDASTWYADADGDGYGDAAISVVGCDQPTGYVSDRSDPDDSSADTYPGSSSSDDDGDGYSESAGDCDDGSPMLSPGGDELCDGQDNDCDGEVDNGASDASIWYADADGDGYGDPDVSLIACDALSGYAVDSSDTDDTDPTEYPGCEDVDDDGDGETDAEGDCDDDDPAITSTTDADGDDSPYCEDCDDTDITVYPGAWERCDGADNDCNGFADTGTYNTYYPDVDGDTYGYASGAVSSCGDLDGYVDDNRDCDDADAEINPDADEVCNGIDDDCDMLVDDQDDIEEWYLSQWYYPDLDKDGYVDSSDSAFTIVWSCAAPEDYAGATGDCDDTNSLVYPNAVEVCDGVRNDCTLSSAYWAANAETLEAEIVSYIGEDGSLIADLGDEIPTSTDTPTTVTLDQNGTLNFCADPDGTTWYAAIEADNVTVTINGLRGSTLTELSGGGVARPIAITYTTADITGLTLSDGYASEGGGLYASYADITMSDTALIDNAIDSVTTYSGDAALTLDDTAAVLTDVYISGSASSYALGCYHCDLQATALRVEGNDNYGLFLYASRVTLDSAAITANGSGGIYISQGDETVIQSSSVDHNSQGIYGIHVGDLNIIDTTISNNGYSAIGGGAIYAYYTGNLTLEDTTIEDNRAFFGGGILLSYDVELSMSGSGACALQTNRDGYANAVYFLSNWTGTFMSSGCTWEPGQGIYLGVTNTTYDPTTLSDPFDFTCTSDGCI